MQLILRLLRFLDTTNIQDKIHRNNHKVTLCRFRDLKISPQLRYRGLQFGLIISVKKKQNFYS